MNLTVCKKLCNECPFSKKSLQGWLGGATIEEMLNAQQYEQLFSCHMQRGENEDENVRKMERGEINICRGFIVSAIISCKVFGQNPITGKALYKLQQEVRETLTQDERDKVLSRFTFPKHHTL